MKLTTSITYRTATMKVYIVETECLVADGTIAAYNTRVWSYY